MINLLQIKKAIIESIQELNAYHGSPFDFDKFNHKKFLGKGCGSQSFGWGTYVTDDETIGRDYSKVGNSIIVIDGFGIENLNDFMNVTGFDLNISNAIFAFFTKGGYTDFESIKNTLKRTLEYEEKGNRTNTYEYNFQVDLLKHIEALETGHKVEFRDPKKILYEVEIPDDNGSNYIDWYGNFPSEFMKRVLYGLLKLNPKYLNNIAENNYPFRSNLYRYIYHKNRDKMIDLLSNEDGYDTFFGNNCFTYKKSDDGKGVYTTLSNWFGSQKAASLFLLNCCGFTGIKYETGTKWKKPDDASDDGHNYVIFNANDIKIKNKNILQENITGRLPRTGYLNSWIDFFRHINGYEDLTQQDLNILMKFNGLKPVNGKYNVRAITKLYDELQDIWSYIGNKTYNYYNSYKHPVKRDSEDDTEYLQDNNIYYPEEDMDYVSHQLLKKDGVMNEGKKIIVNESQFRRIIKEINKQKNDINIY